MIKKVLIKNKQLQLQIHLNFKILTNEQKTNKYDTLHHSRL